MSERTVIVTMKGARYHVDNACLGYQQGLRNSLKLGRQIHPVEHVTEGEARRRGKRPCTRRGGIN
jgi:hypothetical protein